MIGKRFCLGSAAVAALLCSGTTLAPLTPLFAKTAPERPLLRASTAAFDLAFDAASQTLLSLKPKGAAGFDFAPFDREAVRQGDGFYHLGDIDLRLRVGESGPWRDYSSAYRKRPVRALSIGGGTLAAADLDPTFPSDMPLHIERRWTVDGGHLALGFTLRNDDAAPVEVGALGLPMVFDNILTDRTLAQAHEKASFTDPSIARDAGYVQVTRLNGQGPALLVVPQGRTPLEAWKPILDKSGADKRPLIFNDPTKRSNTFEGFYDWMVASRAFAEQEWKGAEQWNPPSGFTLAPGESRAIGVRFLLSPTIRKIEETLAANGRPVAVGIPGYVLPTDLSADLFLKTAQKVTEVQVSPAGAIAVSKANQAGKWTRYRLQGRRWGRARIDIRYADGSVQAIPYFVTKPTAEAVADMGRFLTTRQWYDVPYDPFGRSPSIMSYDHDEGHVVTQEPRVWIAGLSDEGGAGAWLATIMKQLGEPDAGEVAKFERFVTETMEGRLQLSDGPQRHGVRKSLFFHDPKAKPGVRYDPAIDWSTWASWDRKEAASVERSFNYVHVAAAQWVLYRLARYHTGLVKAHDWRWYLAHAYETSLAMVRLAPYYAKFGQMEGNAFVDILKDLKREGMMAQADRMAAVMRARADHWASEAYPFGSEMPWDSTGQSEVYEWMRYFGKDDKAALTREVILGYDPAIPSWGYNGSARRYWDFLYAGKAKRLERQLHHYGSSNNAIPLFEAYRRDPADIHLLRVAYGGLMGSTTNIGQDGFGSAAFHSYPDMMRFDGLSGDYGMSFFGHAYVTASYLVDHPTFGWIGFGGNVARRDGTIHMEPKDSFRMRSFIAPAGLWLTLDAGTIRAVDYAPDTGRVRLTLDPADAHTPAAYLSVETTTVGGRRYRPVGTLEEVRGRYKVPLSDQRTEIELVLVD